MIVISAKHTHLLAHDANVGAKEEPWDAGNNASHDRH